MSDTVTTFTSHAIRLEERDIFAFARQFDPQPYHLDRAEGDASIFGGLCASGWQVAALASRLIGDVLIDAGLNYVDMTAVKDMRWKRPSFADDTVAVRVNLADRREGSPIPGCHTVAASVDVLDSADQIVAQLQCDLAMETHDA